MSSSDSEMDENMAPQYPTSTQTQEATKQLQFVKLLKKYRVLLDKSQIPTVKEAKSRAANAMIAELGVLDGVIMTVAQLHKKISSMKTVVKQKSDAFETGNKKIVLAEWERKLIKLINPDNPILARVPGAAQVGIRTSVLAVRNGMPSSAAIIMGHAGASQAFSPPPAVPEPLPPSIQPRSHLGSSVAVIPSSSSQSFTNSVGPLALIGSVQSLPVNAPPAGTHRSAFDVPPPPSRPQKRTKSQDALDDEETEQTKMLTTPQLNRLVLLRQLKLINMKIRKMGNGREEEDQLD